MSRPENERYPELLARAGQALFGDVWQRNLARALGPFNPTGPRESVDDRNLRRWAAGQRSIPAWVWSAVATLLRDRGEEQQRLIAELDAFMAVDATHDPVDKP